jgi:hypothetical protein
MCFDLSMPLLFLQTNGERYPLVGGTRGRHFTGINFKLRKVPENAQTPTTTPALACGASVVSVISLGSGARLVRRFLLGRQYSQKRFDMTIIA